MKIYCSLLCYGLFPEEQKGYSGGRGGTNDLLYIDQYILKEAKTRRKNVAMVWIDNKIPDMVP